MLQLSAALTASDATLAAKYRTAAGNILASLASPSYLVDPSTLANGMVLHGALNVPANLHDNPCIFGDYFFIEAASEYLAK